MKTLAEWHRNDMPGIGDLPVYEPDELDLLPANIAVTRWADPDAYGVTVWCRDCGEEWEDWDEADESLAGFVDRHPHDDEGDQ